MDEDPPGISSAQGVNQVDGAQNGPLKAKRNRFERILTVPAELQYGLFRWTSEFDVCNRAASLGKALDVVTEIYCELLSQFTRTSDLRVRFMQAPTEFMVAPMYYCDRALDGIVHSVVDIRKNINLLFGELNAVHAKCLQNRSAAQKVYREVEMDARPNMGQFIEDRKAKVTVFRELSERISSVQEGGNSLFTFLDKPWCEKSALCSQIVARNTQNGPPLSNRPASLNRWLEGAPQPGSEHDDKEQEEAIPASCTPDEGRLGLGRATRSQVLRLDAIAPETPEAVRPLIGDGAVTQVSSPRKGRSLSERKRSRSLRSGGDNVQVARNLTEEPSHPPEAVNRLASEASLQSPGPAEYNRTTGDAEDKSKADGTEDKVIVNEDGREHSGEDACRPGADESRKRMRSLEEEQDRNTNDGTERTITPPQPVTRMAVAKQPLKRKNSQVLE